MSSMSKYKDKVKDRMPSKNGGSISGHNIRGRATNMVPGHKKEDPSTAAANHVSRPLADLKDPSSFAPPPKRTGTGLAPAPAASTAKRSVVAAPSKYQDPRGPPVAPPPKISHESQVVDETQQARLEAPRGAYRADTTGLSTSHLPPPPGRRDGADGRSPPPYESAISAPTSRPVPSLPPRLPARSGSASPASPASAGSGSLNQGAVNRLGAAGVSVPAFGIGGSASPSNAGPSSPPPPPRPGGGGGGDSASSASSAHLGELQGRFSKLNTNKASPSPSSPTAPPSQGTTWADKQAAMKSASSFQKDPSSVSLSDARSAASTANNFRQRHGVQVAAGMRTANSLSQKYGGATNATSEGGGEASSSTSAITAAAAKKKPPPPPPKKKPGLTSPSGDAPPPIPMSTRPQF